jgi:UDP-N-acetylmuramate--alanine ligase
MQLENINNVYFIGIGGIGMSALARYFNGRGAEVSGYDKTETVLTKKLVEEGIDIHYEEDLAQLPDHIDLVIYTPAVPATHKELLYLQEKGLPIKKRAEVLGIISRGMRTAAVAGTHGKTSTSTILSYLLREGGIDATAFLGGIALDFESNFVEGKSDWVVVEADEYDRSFLHLSPDVAVILSMDADHLDIYGDKDALYETGFRAFAKKMKPGGQLLVHHQWTHLLDGFTMQSYGLEKGDIQARNLRIEEGYFTFDYHSPDEIIENIQFSMPGIHNVENATAAITLALQVGADKDALRAALKRFKGIRRRFEFLYRDDTRAYIDDYAHHPSELEAAISAAKTLFPDKKILGVFQPHLYSRTKDFADGFAAALDQLDIPVLLPIYPARELPIEGVNANMLLEKMKASQKSLVEKADLMDVIEQEKPDIVLTLGAGDIDYFREPIKNYFNSHA